MNKTELNQSIEGNTPDNDFLVEIKNVVTRFYTEEGVVKAVEGVSFNIKKGEILGLVGESGCGKSVTALSIMNLVRFPGIIEQGEVLFNNQDLLSLSDKKLQKIRGNQITMIFQDPLSSLNPVFSVGEQISEVIQLHKGDSELQAREKAIQLMEKVGIPLARERVYEFPHQFSGGMRQRVMIARAIANKPTLLIADEPTTALDVTIQAQILEIIKELQKETGMSVLLITHNLGVVAENCDRVCVMYGGYIVEKADVENIYVNPIHPYTIALMSAIPRLDISVERLDTLPGSVPDLIDPPSGCRFHPRCKFTTEKCSEEVPILEEIFPNHYAACWNYQIVLNSEERAKVQVKGQKSEGEPE
ncbi:MAG: ABC transporter ATP-binding protein [Candidatus Hodarchaeales archaeon]